jgi:hypothetical protein
MFNVCCFVAGYVVCVFLSAAYRPKLASNFPTFEKIALQKKLFAVPIASQIFFEMGRGCELFVGAVDLHKATATVH